MFSLFQEIKPYSIPKKLSVFMGWGKINMISVKSGSEGMDIIDRKQVTVRRKIYDQRDLS